MRISDWSLDVCSSDLGRPLADRCACRVELRDVLGARLVGPRRVDQDQTLNRLEHHADNQDHPVARYISLAFVDASRAARSEEHTSELQSLMRNSYAVFCLKKKKQQKIINRQINYNETKTHNIQC